MHKPLPAWGGACFYTSTSDNMKKLITILCCAFITLCVSAQEAIQVPKYGYISYKNTFEMMPEYKQAKADFAALKEKYDAEARRAEDEFQRKFAEFLSGQKDFPQSIMLKRQAELQDLMEKSITFRKESERLLAEAEARMQAPIASVLNQAIYDVAAQKGLIMVLNTDNNALPFVHPQAGVDITEDVLSKLGIKLVPVTATAAEGTTPQPATE